jgi:hypothetical protein
VQFAQKPAAWGVRGRAAKKQGWPIPLLRFQYLIDYTNGIIPFLV